MKLYTEEQVVDFTMNMIHQYEFGNKKIWWDKELLKESIQYVTPIELPSDEDIEKMDLGSGMHDFYKGGFIEGSKWMRDKLTNIKEK